MEEVGGDSGAGSQGLESMSTGPKKEGGQVRQEEQLGQRHEWGRCWHVLAGGLHVGWGGGKWPEMGLNKGVKMVFSWVLRKRGFVPEGFKERVMEWEASPGKNLPVEWWF